MKKALCFLLAAALLLPGRALAAEGTGEAPAADREDEVLVQMRVPSSGQVLVNPYRYPVETDDGTTEEQIVSSAQYLVSRSNVPISVSVEVEGTHTDPEAEFVSGAPDPRARELFIYVEFQPVRDGEDPVWIGSYTGADCQVLINESKADAVVIPRGEDSPGMVAFRLFGAVSADPDREWTSDDALSVTMSYKFVPVEETESAEPSETAEEEPAEELPGEEETPEVSEESGTVTEEPEQEAAQEMEPSGETETDEEQAAPAEGPEDGEEEEPPRTEEEAGPDRFSHVEPDRISYHEEDEEDKEEEEYEGISWLDLPKVREETVRDEPDGEAEASDASDTSDTSDPSGGQWLSTEDGAEEAGQGDAETEEEPSGDSGMVWLTLD